jgi:hypothetical protein
VRGGYPAAVEARLKRRVGGASIATRALNELALRADHFESVNLTQHSTVMEYRVLFSLRLVNIVAVHARCAMPVEGEQSHRIKECMNR